MSSDLYSIAKNYMNDEYLRNAVKYLIMIYILWALIQPSPNEREREHLCKSESI